MSARFDQGSKGYVEPETYGSRSRGDHVSEHVESGDSKSQIRGDSIQGIDVLALYKSDRGSGSIFKYSSTDGGGNGNYLYFDSPYGQGSPSGSLEGKRVIASSHDARFRPDDSEQMISRANITNIGSEREPAFSNVNKALSRAQAGGRPVSIFQIGDSHIAEGTQTRAIARQLSERAPTVFGSKGVVGASAASAAHNPNAWLRGLNEKTDLAIISFGSNEAGGRVNESKYASDYRHLISEVKHRAPNASILMVGPTDGARSGQPHARLPGLNSVIAAQRKVATEFGGAYLDMRSHMGSMSEMRAQGLMGGDNLHLTRRGYARVGERIASFVTNTA